MAFFEVARLLLLVIVGFQNSFRHSSVRANDYQEPPKPDSKGRTISPTGYLEGDRLRHTSVGNSTTRLGRESLPSTITRACGHNKAVKHIVEERLSKFSVVSRKTQLALNSRKVAAGQKRREMTQLGDLLFMDDVFPFETSTVVWQEEAPPEAPAPLRFHAEFRLEQLEISQPNKAAFLRKELVPAMIASLRHYVNVRRPLPPEQPLFLPRHCKTPWGEAHGSRCKSVQPIGTCLAADHEPDFFGPYTLCSSPDTSTCRRYPGGAGVSNADFVLYVSASPSLCGKGTAAFAGACELDPATFRPVAGEINFCPDFILTSVKDWGYMLDTSVHEMMHALVMHSSLFPYFIDSSLEPRQGVTTRQEKGQSYAQYGVTTPAVLAAYREHTSCQSLDAVPLENDGGEGTALAHWEFRAMLDEIMVGISGPAGFQRQVMSNMTLALMADSGWYVPNWEASGYLKWGRKAGCDFLHGSCVTGNNRTSPKGFCTRQPGQERQVSLCSWDLMAVGTCQSSSLGDGCAIRMKYSDYVCSNTTQGNPLYQESKADWGETFGPHARCLGESDVRPVRRVFNVGQEPSIAEQWPGMELQDGSHIKRQMGAGCYKMGCSDAGELHVVVAGVRLPCPENGFLELGASKSLRSLGFVEGRLGPCPSSLLVCPELQCTEACEARGSCVAGSCGCHVGASGPDCGDMLCGNGTCLGQRDNLLCAERTCGQTNAILSLEPGESRPATNIMDVQLGQLPVGSILGSRSEILSTPRAGEDTIPGHVLAENGGSRHASNCRVAPASRGDAPSQHNSATDNCDPSRFARDVHQISFAPSSRHSLSKRPDTLLVLYFLTTWTIAYAWVVVA